MTKDVVCHAIAKARKTFDHPDIENKSIRSHSGRHRMINDIKYSSIPEDAGMLFARIRDKKTWAGYGKLTPTQCGDVMEKNARFKKSIRKLYS